MWSRASTDNAGPGPRMLMARAARGARGNDFASRSRGGVIALALVVASLLAACGSAPTKPTESSPQPAAADAGKPGTNGAGANGAAAGGPNGASPNGAAAVPITARGKADFERAVGLMKAGNATEAELEFKQVALQFPQLSAPYVNLGILYRKAGHLDQSEEALKTAVERNDGSAVAWTELGATQRLRGEFPDAAASYEKAIAADPNFAPAYRNLGVVSDLYLGDPERALTAFERYKELTGEEKPVSGWIAELRQRTGKPPLKRPQPAPAAGSPDAAPGGATPNAPQGGQGAPGASPPTTPDQKPAEPAPAAPPPKAGG
jgi:Flp pilus assembly protein TadD